MTDQRHVIRVSPGTAIARPSAAAAVAQDRDVIEIAAGLYENDWTTWVQNDLRIRGIGGRVHLKADGRISRTHERGMGIWVLRGRNTVIEHIEFSGASNTHRN